MTHLMQSIHHAENTIMNTWGRFAEKHPYLTMIGMSVGLPLFVVAGVAGTTWAVIAPLSCLLGWV